MVVGIDGGLKSVDKKYDFEERLARIALNFLPQIGGLRLQALLKRYRRAKSVLEARQSELSRVPGIGVKGAAGIKALSLQDAEVEYEKAAGRGIEIVCLGESGYPESLACIPQPPAVLYIWGCRQTLAEPMVGIVGCRRPTSYGIRTAGVMSRGLVRAGFVVVSGLARGIDSEAHRAALAAGGRTVAALAAGFDHIYPPENKQLLRKMVDGGVAVSEFPLRMKPLKQNFPFRNRIISGLSRGVVVVQGQRGSGALITANFALEQGREVFAVPGEVGIKESEGPHTLIRQGARLVRDVTDILKDLEYESERLRPQRGPDLKDLTAVEEKVLRAIGKATLHPDEVIVKTEISAGDLMQVLLGLELKGFVRRTAGERYFLSGKL